MPPPMQTQNTPSPSRIPIPPFAEPLAPYIKTRQEALRIRQVLTCYLRSLITFAPDDPDHPNRTAQSHLALSVPHDAVVDVKPIPDEVTGLRREYLQALQANVAARREYEDLVERETKKSEVADTNDDETRQEGASLELSAYLRLLRERRQHAKLQAIDHYLQQLRTRNVMGPEDLEKEREKRGPRLAMPEGLWDGGEQRDGGRGSEERVEGLVHDLERAVIRAKARLDREKRLFEEVKARHDAAPPAEVDPAVKAAALQRTRDELVQWVEEKLVSAGNPEERTFQPVPPEEVEESQRLLEDQTRQIAAQYTAYVDARKRLLDAAARACQPIANPSSTSTKAPSRPTEPAKTTNEMTPSIQPVDVVSFASDVLLPLSKSQRALTLQKTFLAGLLGKEKADTLRMLNRLSDESHLLPEYPILARQPRFKHAAAALSSRQAGASTEPTKPDEVVSMAEAWAFASEAASSTEREYVEEKLVDGSETAKDAQQTLQELYQMLNQDLGETLQDEEEGKEDDDLWAHEAQSRGRVHRATKRAQGPWSRVNGKIGVE